MIDFFLAGVCFGISIILHIHLHTVLTRWGVRTIKSMAVFLVGLTLYLGATFLLRDSISLVWSTTLFYSLLTGIYAVFYTAPLLTYDSPTTKIYRLLRAKRNREKAQILAVFTKKEILFDRLGELKNAGLIRENDEGFSLTKKGWRYGWWIQGYKRILYG